MIERSESTTSWIEGPSWEKTPEAREAAAVARAVAKERELQRLGFQIPGALNTDTRPIKKLGEGYSFETTNGAKVSVTQKAVPDIKKGWAQVAAVEIKKAVTKLDPLVPEPLAFEPLAFEPPAPKSPAPEPPAPEPPARKPPAPKPPAPVSSASKPPAPVPAFPAPASPAPVPQLAEVDLDRPATLRELLEEMKAIKKDSAISRMEIRSIIRDEVPPGTVGWQGRNPGDYLMWSEGQIVSAPGPSVGGSMPFSGNVWVGKTKVLAAPPLMTTRYLEVYWDGSEPQYVETMPETQAENSHVYDLTQTAGDIVIPAFFGGG